MKKTSFAHPALAAAIAVAGALGLGGAALGACASPNASRECANGLFCPEGTECSADLTTCIRSGGCGNALVGGDEQCDDGNFDNTDECLDTCRLNVCGDGFVNLGVEECDDANDNEFDDCLTTCELNVCGDGNLDMQPPRTEVCDDGNTVDSDECYNDCSGGVGCGNGQIDRDQNGLPIEECDDGNTNNNDLCVLATAAYECRRSRCGDGYVASDAPGAFREDCDAAAPMSTGGPVESATCDIDCTTRVCGDGEVNGTAGEQCDDGDAEDGDGCDSNCAITRCGNGRRTGDEQCDDGNNTDGDGCDSNCKLPGCPNGVVNSGEECDDGNMASGDGCDMNCKFTRCGNGVMTGSEQCDDGNLVDTDACTSACKTAVCGDDIIRAGVETCDDGNATTEECPYGTSCNVCNASCQLVAGEADTCNDGTRDMPFEACDDGNAACGSCNATCSQSTLAKATGAIVVLQASLFADGETFTLNDGFHAPTVFELDSNTMTTTGNVVITISGGGSANTIRQRVVTAINEVGDTLWITASGQSGSLVALTHDLATARGNQPITEAVTNGDFTVTGMSGGGGGDCTAGQACRSNADCASSTCTAANVCM